MNSVTKKTCPHCKKEFLTRDSSKVFCSLSCEDDHKNADMDKKIMQNHKPGRPSGKPKEGPRCLECGEPIKQSRGGRKKFCCDYCRWGYHARLKREKRPPKTADCPVCGIKFVKQTPKQKFCSNDCRKKYHKSDEGRKSASDNYKKQLEKTVLICQICGKEFQATGINTKYCFDCSNEKRNRDSRERQLNHRKAFEKMNSLKTDIEAKIKASEEALAKSEREQLQLKARIETLYEIYNNLRENAA